MGKERTKRYKPAKYQPVELEAGNLIENEEKIRGTVSNIIGMLNSVSCEERECGCGTIANFVSQSETIPLLLRSNVIKIMGPLMMDSNLSVRCAAVGAFRNLSVAGGEDVCNEMVKEDILTSLVALFKQYEPGWIPNSSQHTDLNSVVFVNAVHLLWNLCEFSEVAVKVVNQQDLMSLLMSCINPEKYDHLICTAAAQCIYTASESNREAVILLSLRNHKAVLERFMRQKTGDNTHLILLRTLLTGIAYNIITQQEESADLGVIHSIVNVLSDTLSFEVVNHVQLAVQALKQMQQKEKDECAMDPVEPKLGAMADDLERRSHAADKSIEYIENILNAQKLSLEMIANLCCLNSEDEDWEDIDSSDGSLEDLSNHQDEEMQENNNLEIQSKLEVDAHEAIIQQDIFAKVVSMCDMFMLEESIHDQLASYSSGIRVLKTLEICSERAMLCLANLLSNIGSELLGGIDAVQNVWLKLSKLLTNRKVVDNVELLDAVSTALRSIAQKLAEGNPVQFKEVTESDLQVLFEMGLKCNVNQVRANAVSIISTIGTSLAKQSPPHPLLQHIGHYFLEIVACDTQLWVIAEALDAIFDVFSEDHTNCVLQQISLVEKLKEFIPVLKQRVKKEKRSLGEHLPVIYTARNNLVRFIQYKEKVMS